MSSAKSRKSLSIRLQPYTDSPLSEVIDYLKSLDTEEANRRIGEVLVMCLLPYARLHEAVSDEELRVTCLESCDALDKHASTMRQALKVPQLQFSHPGFVHSFPSQSSSSSSVIRTSADREETQSQKAKSTLSPIIQDKDPIESIDRLFD
ncbi:hypothetical protein [Leptolyngbya sp. NIES-2104]|uniref:hypothetical protein n=1 Tax=Leptolyngbya sp. NIES-2104 TaxID=1552121 RepID=UPI00073E79E9|nr:hypothetical protein [Leptolyngbya sp. NIES-2104]